MTLSMLYQVLSDLEMPVALRFLICGYPEVNASEIWSMPTQSSTETKLLNIAILGLEQPDKALYEAWERDRSDLFYAIWSAYPYLRDPYNLYPKSVAMYECLTQKCKVAPEDLDVYSGSLELVLKYGVAEVPTDPEALELLQLSFVMACRYGNFEVIKYMTSKLQVQPDRHAMWNGCRNNTVQVVKYLISLGVQHDPADLNTACYHGDPEVIRYLIADCKLQPTVENLLDACGRSDPRALAVIKYLMDEAKIPLSLTALHQAYAGGSLEVIKYLLTQIGATPTLDNLHQACRYNTLDVVQYLISRVQPTSYQYPDMLMSACQDGIVEVVRFLHSEYKLQLTQEHLIAACTGGGARSLGTIKYLVETCGLELPVLEITGFETNASRYIKYRIAGATPKP